ncbi:hypothetical protein [Nocardioides sp.]|uniref:hypothetical protein n=1 Tax=Nocardioides sp. TaxID=35761 RepID=UPI003516C1DB
MTGPAAPPVGSRYADLTRAQLAVVVPELLLIGQLIDRSGMAWCISAFGREEMARIAIEEWAGASPIYTRRMQQALGYAPEVAGEGDVVTIFKGLQLDIGAPPQFMDFRYQVRDRWHGSFHLDHCGALMDVEPMGPEYVRSMCHDIEDPTFDATAVATNPRAQVRPLHRPPRVPADRAPHCAWTVVIDPAHPPVEPLAPYHRIVTTAAAGLALDPVPASTDPEVEGWSDYAGPLLDDLDFTRFSHAALVRIADEVCLQMHLLNLSFVLAVRARCTSEEQARAICRKQLVGIAGLAAERLARALGLGTTPADAVRVLAMHPLLNPLPYAPADLDPATARATVRPGPAHGDDGWLTLCGPATPADPEAPSALQALVRGVDPRLDVEVEPAAEGDGEGWSLRVVQREDPAAEAGEVAVTRFSTGAGFVFEPRRSLPLLIG